MPAGKKILLGVSGSIAAYKSATLIRLLVKSGAEVKVIMTPSAHDFITPLTLATLSKNPVLTEFNHGSEGLWNNHVDLGLWADLLVIAPASANTLAKMAHGICDNLLQAVYLSARCPVWVAPAMDLDMWAHPATTGNLHTLQSHNVSILEPNSGELASGLVGQGRMAEPEEIFAKISAWAHGTQSLQGQTILITAGPTYEAIDPVRFIGNHSSGKMGYALAEEFASRGATVQLISGPTHLHTKNPAITVYAVTSAEEMYLKAMDLFPTAQIAVLAAAVADYRPATVADQKIKKSDNDLSLQLVKTRDIAASLGAIKKPHQKMVGFALETENAEANALGKLNSKNFDLIVLNQLGNPGVGFGYDTNKITILTKTDKKDFSLKSKTAVAADIANAIENL